MPGELMNPMKQWRQSTVLVAAKAALGAHGVGRCLSIEECSPLIQGPGGVFPPPPVAQ